MAEVTGTVTRVVELDKRDGKDPLRSISIEGISMLAPADMEVPGEGALVRVNVDVMWKKGKPPVHWLRAWDPIIGGREGR